MDKLVEALNQQDSEEDTGMSQAHQAAIDGNLELLKILSLDGKDLNEKDCQGMTPLH